MGVWACVREYFMLIFQGSNWLLRCKNIVDEFEREALTLFDGAAPKAGGIGAEDRHGVQQFLPCTTLSIGAVRTMPGRFRHAEEVANLAAAAKHEAKQAGTGVWLHGGSADSTLGGLAASRALQDVLAA